MPNKLNHNYGLYQYQLHVPEHRRNCDLTKYRITIKKAILSYVNNAYDINIFPDYYEYKCDEYVSRKQLSWIGEYLSLHTSLRAYVKKYKKPNKQGRYTRRLFQRIK